MLIQGRIHNGVMVASGDYISVYLRLASICVSLAVRRGKYKFIPVCK